jgi:hypothetical protein
VDDVLVHDRVKGAALEVVERLEAELVERGAIGEEDPVARIPNRDGLAERL